MIYRLMSFETSIFRICGFPPHKPSSQHLQFHRETLAKVCKSCRKKLTIAIRVLDSETPVPFILLFIFWGIYTSNHFCPRAFFWGTPHSSSFSFFNSSILSASSRVFSKAFVAFEAEASNVSQSSCQGGQGADPWGNQMFP